MGNERIAEQTDQSKSRIGLKIAGLTLAAVSAVGYSVIAESSPSNEDDKCTTIVTNPDGTPVLDPIFGDPVVSCETTTTIEVTTTLGATTEAPTTTEEPVVTDGPTTTELVTTTVAATTTTEAPVAVTTTSAPEVTTTVAETTTTVKPPVTAEEVPVTLDITE